MNYTLLLDDSTAFDNTKVQLLESAIETMNKGINISEIQVILTQLLNHPAGWRLIEIIFAYSHHEATRLFAISLFKNGIKTRWNTIAESERQSIPVFILNLSLIAATSNQCSSSMLTKLNSAVVDVAKLTWPSTWPEFLNTLLMLNDNISENQIYNNLSILKLFIEDVVEYGQQELTKEIRIKLQTALFSKYDDIIMFVFKCLTKYQHNLKIVSLCLNLISLVLKEARLDYICQTQLLNHIIDDVWHIQTLRIQCTDILIETITLFDNYIRGYTLNKNTFDYSDKYLYVVILSIYDCFNLILKIFKELPENSWIYDKSLPLNKQNYWNEFFMQLSIAFTILCKNCLYHIIDNPNNRIITLLCDVQSNSIYNRLNIKRKTFYYLYKLTALEHEGVFYTMAEFWSKYLPCYCKLVLEELNNYDQPNYKLSCLSDDPNLYEIVNDLREITVNKMLRPPEVYLVYDEETQTCSQNTQKIDNTETSLYSYIKIMLTELTKLSNTDMLNIYDKMLENFSLEIKNDRSKKCFNINDLNKLCWSVGSCVGVMNKELECKLFIKLTKQLLSYCQAKKGINSKSAIAAMIMYIIGQFAKYVKTNSTLLTIVIKKNLEFILDLFPGIQDMAVETLYKLANSCGKEIYCIDNNKLIYELITQLPKYTQNLTKKKCLLLFYECVGIIIYKGLSTISNETVININNPSSLICQPLNDSFVANLKLLINLCQNSNVDSSPHDLHLCVLNIHNIIQINERLCEGMKRYYIIDQFYKVYNDIISLYNFISEQLAMQSYKNQLLYKDFILLRKAILSLMSSFCTYMNSTVNNKNDENYELYKNMNSMVILYIINNIFEKFSDSNSTYNRDEQVINLASQLIVSIWQTDQEKVELIMNKVFVPSLSIIKSASPEQQTYSVYIYKLVNALVETNFNYLITTQYLASLYNCITFGIQSEYPENGNISIKILNKFLDNIHNNFQLKQQFVDKLYYNLINTLTKVFVDYSHSYGNYEQAKFLYKLVMWYYTDDSKIISMNKIGIIIFQCVIDLYPYAPKNKLKDTINNLFTTKVQEEFIEYCMDILIIIKEFAND